MEQDRADVDAVAARPAELIDALWRSQSASVADLLDSQLRGGDPGRGRRGRRPISADGRRRRSRSSSSTTCRRPRSSDAEPPGDLGASAASSCAARSTAAEAEAWDAELGDYLERNAFLERLLGSKYPAAATGLADLADLLVAPAGAGPPARQHGRRPPLPERPLAVRLRRCRSGSSPISDIGYPDRVRRRRAGRRGQGSGGPRRLAVGRRMAHRPRTRRCSPRC